jgi:hypothetical protein
MRLGTESKKKLGIMAALMVVAAISVGRTVVTLGAKPAALAAAPATTRVAAQPSATRVVAAARDRRQIQVAEITSSLDPTLRLDLLKLGESTEYRGSGRNIFKPHEEPPPIPEPVSSAVTGPPAPPPPPPINLKFFGFANHVGERKKIFLAQGEDVFVAGEGEIVNRRYRVLRINPSSVEMEDLLTNHRQTIPLT